jgi:serine/threonine protein kinase
MDPADIQRVVGERYRVVHLIGQGAFGTVVEAVDMRLERRVAIKVLVAAVGDEGRERFVREARVMAKVRGDHLLTIYDCLLGADGTPFLVMELVDGSLGGWLKLEPPMDWPVATAIVTQVARGLDTLHRDGSVHGDIKPGNILIDRARARVLLGDFGLAGTLAASHVQGTPAYMSPEAFRGAMQDARSDLYALGVVLYELLTGTRPLAMASTLSEIFSRRLSEPPPSPQRVNAKLPSALNTITIRLLAVDPADRFQTAAELGAALHALGRSRWWKRRTKRKPEAEFADWLLHARPASPAVTSDEDLATVAEPLDPAATSDEDLAFDTARRDRTLSLSVIPQSVFDKVRDEGEQCPVAWLIVMVEPGKEEQHRLRGTTLVGRDPDCQIMLDNALVSSRHFAIEVRDDGFYLADLGSTNGTLLNGQRATGPTRLHDRDVIQVGSTRMLFIQAATGERDAAAQRRTGQFSAAWQARLDSVGPGELPDIAALAHRLTHDLLREALGYRVERTIPSYRGIAGYMVEAPMLWIRTTRFPILYVPSGQGVTLGDITAQLAAARATDYLAVLVVVPPAEETGREAAELRRLVANSPHRYDLVVLDRGDLERIIAAGDSKTLIDLFVEQGIALGRLSPYVIRGPVPENMFFGREAEIKELSHNVRNHAVQGGRRMGKSSMFLRLRRLLANDPRFHGVYINCEPCFDHGDFLAAFSAAVAATEPITEVAALRLALPRLADQHEGKTSIFLLDEVDELVAFDARGGAPGRLFKSLRALSHEQIG